MPGGGGCGESARRAIFSTCPAPGGVDEPHEDARALAAAEAEGPHPPGDGAGDREPERLPSPPW